MDTDPIIFTEKLVHTIDETIKLHVTSNKKLRLNIYQLDQIGTRNIINKTITVFNNYSPQIYSSTDGFVTNGEIVEILPKAPGWLIIEVDDTERTRKIPTFVESTEIEPIVFVEAIDTLLAYNPGADLYGIPNYYNKRNEISESIEIPLRTPIISDVWDKDEINKKISCKDHLINADLVHRMHLHKLGIQFSQVSDSFLDKNIPKHIKVIILGSHNEFWTAAKADNISRFVQNGGKLLILGGNTAWREVFRVGSSTWIHGDGLYEKPIFRHLFDEVLGTYFTDVDYNTYAPLSIVDKNILENRFNITAEVNQEFSNKSNFAHCEKTISGGSGLETDKLISNDPNFKKIAKGQNINGGADVVYKVFDGGGEVLNFGTVALWHNLQDDIIKELIQNFIRPHK